MNRRVTLTIGPAPARLNRLLAVFVAVSIGGLAVAALCRSLHEIDYRDLIDSLAAMPGRTIIAALAATALSYAVLFANDFSALRYAGAAPPPAATVLASFCGYAVGNFVGFAALSGGAVRYRIYSAAGVSRGEVARITVYIATAFGVGAAETIALGLAFRAREIAQLCGVPDTALRLVAASILAATVLGLIGCAVGRRRLRCGPLSVELPGSGLIFAQIAVTAIDIVTASAALWVLLPASGIDFPAFVVIYTAALSLGVLSHSPGGIGAFGAAVLYAVGAPASPSAVAAALLAYRAIYFLLPFAIAAVLLLAAELQRLRQRNPVNLCAGTQ